MRLSLCSINYKFRYVDGDRVPTLYLFCRDMYGKRWIITDSSFLPYFYVWEYDWSLGGLSEAIFSNTGKPSIKGTLRNYYHSHKKYKRNELKTVDGKQVVKVFVDKPAQVRKIRQDLRSIGIEIFESDVLFSLRYLIDKKIKSGIEYDSDIKNIKPYEMPSKLKTIYLDIEVLAQDIPELEEATGEICTIGIFDTLEKRFYLLTLIPKESLKENIDLTPYIKKGSRIVELRKFVYEKDLIYNFIDLIRELEPDVIMTFTPFDIMYIIRRCMKNGIQYARMSPLNIVTLRKGELPSIHGISVMDLARMYRQVIGEPKWEKLEAIAQRELEYGRLFWKENIVELFKTDYKKILYRNVRDVELIKELDKTCGLLTYFDTIRKAVGCNFKDTLYPSRIADILYLREVYGTVVLPTKMEHESTTYKGAFVFDCKKGIYDNVIVADFSEMYPSIIDTFNISYDTYSKDGDIIIKRKKQNTKGKWYTKKYRFKSSPVGWTPKILNQLRMIRNRVKNNLKNIKDLQEYRREKAKSDGYKAVCNAGYGLYGYSGNKDKHRPASRLFNIDIAECITFIGREVQEKAVIPALEKKGYNIIYSDTDSTFIKLERYSDEETQEIVNYINRIVTDFIKDKWKVKSKMSLDLDKVFKRIILVTKKKYKGITLDGKMITKGMEQIRGDTADVTGEVQDNIGKLILESKPKEDVINYVKDVVNNFRSYPLTYISIPKRLSKRLKDYSGVKKKIIKVKLKSGKISERKIGIPENVKAFIRGREYLKENLKEGERFYLIHTLVPIEIKNKVNKKTKQMRLFPLIKEVNFAVGYKDPDKIKDKINYSKMLKLTVRDKIEDLLELLDIKWNEIIRNH